MTNLQAIQSTVAGYPLSENTFVKALLDRGVSSTGTYTGTSKAFELATADVYMVLATAANISEGGFSVSISEKQNFLRQANSIYTKYPESDAASNSNIIDMTSRW